LREPAPKPAAPTQARVLEKKEPLLAFGPVVTTRSKAGDCNGILLDRDTVLLPSHCVEGTSVTFPTHSTVVSTKVERFDAGVTGVEAMIKATVRVPPSLPVTPIDQAKITWPEAFPSAYRLSLVFDFGGTKRDLPCLVVTFDPGASVGYHCQTSPGHSGSLILDKEGAPLAVHLGKKDGLGYGLLLATILSRPASHPPLAGEVK
jgi:hypothetical protein